MTFATTKNNANREITIQIGNKESFSKTLPLVITEKITTSKSLDEIKVWKILPQPAVYRDTESMLIKDAANPIFTVFNQNHDNIIDNSRSINNPHPINLQKLFESTLYIDSICKENNNEVKGPAQIGYPLTVPLLSNVDSIIYVKYSDFELIPINEVYNLKFSSFYETKIDFPKNAIILRNDRTICSIDYEGLTKAYFYNIAFKIK